MNFDLDPDSRLAIWNLTIKEIEDYYSNTEKLRVAPELKILKAARACGLGMQSVRNISVDDSLSMDIQMLEQQIKIDLSNGFYPLMIIATAGTTGAGVIDPLYAINNLAKKYNMWLHVDAAYGGGLCLSDQSHLLNGIEFANSITFDAHKWMSVPMSASLYLTRHKNILEQTFRITTDYMPKEAKDMPVIDPFVHSIQWSRRFIGLKIYLPFLFFGWEGYKTIINKQMEMGRLLRKKLTRNGWKIYNNTELPVICFGKESFEQDPTEAQAICNKLIGTGTVWLSVYSIRGTNTLRVCITNYDTKEEHIDSLVEDLKNYN